MKARAKIIRWIAIILVLVTIAAFFLPYVSSIGNAREVYERLSDDTASEKPHMTYGQLKDLSLFEYVKLYILAADSVDDAMGQEGAAIFYAVLIGAVALFSVLLFLSVLRDKPILAIILDVLLGALIVAINWDFKDRNIINDFTRGWGFAHYLYPVLIIVIAVLEICFLVSTHKQKKPAGAGVARGICPQCEADRIAGKRFCTRCGAVLAAPQPAPAPAGSSGVNQTAGRTEQPAGCPACERNRLAGRRFCPQCGTRLLP